MASVGKVVRLLLNPTELGPLPAGGSGASCALLNSLYSVRSERAFCEELEYNLVVPLVFGHEPDGA